MKQKIATREMKLNFNKILILIVIFFLYKCKHDTINIETDWSIGITEPYGYPIGNGDIYFFNNKNESFNFPTVMKSIGWANILNVRKIKNTQIPDSIFVSYSALGNDNKVYWYEGGIKLSELKIIDCLKKSNGYYNDAIYCGLAPGGNVCVFVGKYELIRFKAKKRKENKEDLYFLGDKNEQKELFDFLKKNPINYSNWEKNDKCYNFDIGFTSEDENCRFLSGKIFSKEGIVNDFTSFYIDSTKWNKPCNSNVDYQGDFYLNYNEDFQLNKIQLPIRICISWYSNIQKKYFYTDIILPKNFSQKFTKSYTDPVTGEQAHYNRLVFGVEKDGVHCIVWLDGPNKQEKLMRFKGQIEKTGNNNMSLSGGYATEVTYY